MRNWRRRAASASAAAAVIAALQIGATPASGQGDVYKAPRTADGKPNLNGIWQALNTANWDLQDTCGAARTGGRARRGRRRSGGTRRGRGR